MYAGFKDFHFYRVAVERAHLVAGFGKIRWLSAAELNAAPASGLADAEPGIVSHMNDDHADAVQLYAGKLLGLAGSDWRMTGHRRRGDRSAAERAGGPAGLRGAARLRLPRLGRCWWRWLVGRGRSDSAARHLVRGCEI